MTKPILSELSLSLSLILILFGAFHYSFTVAIPEQGGLDRRTRTLLAAAAYRKSSNRQSSDCPEMASESQCLKNPKCRWCRSQALDDMCFSKVEAWRLPSQVFSCQL